MIRLTSVHVTEFARATHVWLLSRFADGEKGTLWRLLDVQANTGMLITESFAMWPGSSVSGLYFAHPESRYFSLGKIDRDQAADYSEHKKTCVTEVERWLGQNLNYDPAE